MQVRFVNKWLPYVLLSPNVIIVLIFFVLPSLQSLRASFYSINISGSRQIFVGLRNFIRLFSTTEYLNSLQVTFLFSCCVVIIGLLMSLPIAILANSRLPGFQLYRTLLVWPYALSANIAAIIWGLIFEPTIGIMTNLLQLVTIRFDWRNSATHALVFICIVTIWKMLGYNIIFSLAALQGLPTDVLEAALIDGASAWKRFWHITFPLLSPTIFFLFVMNTLYAFFESFGLIHVTTNGGPGRATDLMVYKLYRDGFVGLNTGSSSAQSVILLIVVIALMVLQFHYAGRYVFYEP